MSHNLLGIVDRLVTEGLLRGVVDAASLPPGQQVRAVTTDSREVAPGTLFCAIRGTTGDGHRFLSAAREAGALAALVEEIDESVPLRQIEVVDGRLAAAYAAAAFYGDPWSEITLVGVTGTNGKTTSVAILRHLLDSNGPAASIGTLGAVGPDGAVIPGTEGLTTPGPVDVPRWLRRLGDAGALAVAMEVSSHALDQNRVAAARFDAALYTNLSRDHLDYHGTLEAYRQAKLRLVELVKPGGAVVVNADDPAWRDIQSHSARVVSYGIESAADVRAEDVRFGGGGMEWTLRTPGGAADVRLPLYGSYNVANALGAAAVLWSLGWGEARIAEGLASLPQVPGRLERVPTPEGAAAVLIDYAHTPDALARALAALRPLVEGRLIVLFGAGGDRDRGKRPEMGRIAAEGADLSIVTSDNPRTEDPARILDEIEAGMGGAPRRRVLDRREAIRTALDLAEPGDLVLLAGKGHETYQIRGTRKYPFDERVVVREILAERGEHT
ncbi:MAG TPA: UDP-N-acetylmuramoyl-L-alanyl-D-glutamate--2,6-diaminopimelate ligase [Longimicrobiaceae bacterium]|nr:UDP-N-acetylmuramoyl-L-alanyl-D-glutamate--2,6-diaminopimelate ligase [Longimicrobiaceae bacterium]